MKHLFSRLKPTSSIDPLHVLNKPVYENVSTKSLTTSGKVAKRFGSSNPSKLSVLAVALISGAFGGYFIFQSFAATATSANLWVDLSGGACTRATIATSYNDGNACGSFDAAWDKASAGDVIVVKAGIYPRQIVTGDKTSETKIIGEDGTKVAGVIEDCKPEFGSAAIFCANAAFMTLENVTIDSENNMNRASGSQINAANVTYRNVNLYGTYVNLVIDAPNFTWQKGSHGQDGVIGGERNCAEPGGQPVWVFSTNAVLDGIRFNVKKIRSGGTNNYCGADVTPHLETIRTESGATNLTVKNSWFVAGSDAGSGHIFTSTGAPGLKLLNNLFEPVNGTYAIQAGSSTCDWTVAYNTFQQGMVLGCDGGTWVGNLGVALPGCGGTHTKNVWQGSGSCGSDKFVGSTSLGIGSGGRLTAGSPAIDAAETDTSSDFCTSTLGSVDFLGSTRPQGTACDAGAHEFGSSSAPPIGSTANLWVDPNGGSCARQAAPAAYNDGPACASMQAAWNAASAGDIIRVKSGTYGDQSIAGDKTAETKVIGEDGVTIGSLTTNGSLFTLENVSAASWSSTAADVSNVTLRNVNISGNGGVYLAGEGYSNFKWERGSLRNFSCSNCPAAMAIYAGNNVGGTALVSNFIIDGVTFDNIKNTGGTANHFEVIRIDGNVNGFTLKNSTFTNTDASSSTLFFTTFRGDKPQNINIENNFFSTPGAAFFVINENFQGSTCSNWNMRYNTFKTSAAAGGNCSYTNIEWTGNLGPAGNCEGSSFINNVWYGTGAACGASDKIITSPGFDTDGFHLLSSSLARDKAGVGINCVANDHDGDARPNGAACDAGADEYTGTTPAPTPPPPTPMPPPPAGSILFGNQSVEGLADGLSIGQVEAWPFNAVAAGVAGTISLNLDNSSTAQGVKVGIYADLSGSPGALLSQATISSPIGGWNTASLSPQINITNGTQYWIAVLGTGSGQVVVRDRGSGGTCTAKINAVPNDWNTVGLKNPFGPTGGDFAQCPLSAYVSSATSADTTAPSTPTNLAASSASATGVNLTWTASTDSGTNASGLARYNVLRGGVVVAQLTPTQANCGSDTSCAYTNTGLSASTSYSYVVQAADTAGNTSANSNTATVTTPAAADNTAPTTPSNLAASTVSTTQINLSWSGSTDTGGSGLKGYNVYRNGSTTPLNSSLITTTTYGDSTAQPGTSYSYVVEAIDGAGNKSAKSASVSATTPLVLKPGDITGSTGSPDGQIDLADISYVIRRYNTTDPKADLTGPTGTKDGKVDIYDLSFIIRNYGK